MATSVSQPWPLTAAEKYDIRRYCGYPAVATSLSPEAKTVSTGLDAAIDALTHEQISAIRTVYITNLQQLEQDLFNVRANLDTEQASVWKKSPTEYFDRLSLFNSFRLQLCYAVGVSPGTGLLISMSTPTAPVIPAKGGTTSSFVPAVLVV